MKTFLLALAMIGILPFQAFAVGEVFKIENTGTEYCGDLDRTNVNANNNVDLWVLIVSDQELTVSTTAAFLVNTTFTLLGETYTTGPSTAAFVGSFFGINNSFATIQGIMRFNRLTGDVTSLTGTFTENSVLAPNCFSTGRFTSRKVSG